MTLMVRAGIVTLPLLGTPISARDLQRDVLGTSRSWQSTQRLK